MGRIKNGATDRPKKEPVRALEYSVNGLLASISELTSLPVFRDVGEGLWIYGLRAALLPPEPRCMWRLRFISSRVSEGFLLLLLLLLVDGAVVVAVVGEVVMGEPVRAGALLLVVRAVGVGSVWA